MTPRKPVDRATHPHIALVVGLAVTLAGGWWKTDGDKSKQIAELQARSTDMPARRDRELDQAYAALRGQLAATEQRVGEQGRRIDSIEQYLRGGTR